MSVRGEVRRRRLTPYSHVLRATDATSLSAQKQSSQTKTKERPALLLDPGIPMVDNMTISSWVHFPLPSSSPFMYNPDMRIGSPLKSRRHRWTTLFYGTLGKEPGAGCKPGEQFNHVCILHFKDNMDHTHADSGGGQGTKTGAQFGISCPDDNTIRFEAFEAGDGEPQRHISDLEDGWRLVTLVTSPHQDSLFVDGKVRVLLPLASSPLSSLHASSCTAAQPWGKARCSVQRCPITAIGDIPPQRTGKVQENFTAIGTTTVCCRTSTEVKVLADYRQALAPRPILLSAEHEYPPAPSGTAGSSSHSSRTRGGRPSPLHTARARHETARQRDGKAELTLPRKRSRGATAAPAAEAAAEEEEEEVEVVVLEEEKEDAPAALVTTAAPAAAPAAAALAEQATTDALAVAAPLVAACGRGGSAAGGRGGRSDELQLDVEADVTPPDARLSATPPVHGALARVAALEVLLVGKVLLGPLFMRIAALEGQPDDPPTNLRDALARLGALESMT
jgi:hypothetical protein